MNTLHHGVFRLGRALDFNTSLHLEELPVYGSVRLGASTHDACSVCYYSNLAYAGSYGTGEGKRACTWAGGGGATIVLEDLGADAPATVTRAEFGMCAGHGVRSPTSSKVQEAGPSHGLGRGVRPLRSLRGAGRLLGVLGHAGAVATPAILKTLFKSPTALGSKLFV